MSTWPGTAGPRTLAATRPGGGCGSPGRLTRERRSQPESAAVDLETGACGCCGTRSLADRRGNIYLMYRAATAGVERDMYLLSSRDHGSHFQARSSAHGAPASAR